MGRSKGEDATLYGGQALLEGVMMLGPRRAAIAVRKPDGEIEQESFPRTPLKERYPVLGWPILRGMAGMCSSMAIGFRALTRSAEIIGLNAEEEEPGRLERFIAGKTGKTLMDAAILIAIVVAVLMAVGLFVALPALFATFIKAHITSKLLVNVLEGLARLAVFIAYLAAITLMPDIRRTFAYHGAEHMTVNCYEAGEDMTVENIRRHSTRHPRCGTSLLLMVMVISLLAFSFLGRGDSFIYRFASRLLLLPLVAGLSYEAQKLLAKGAKSLFARFIMAPGMWLQGMTTRKPDDDMLNVALCAFESARAATDDAGDPTDAKDAAPDRDAKNA